MRIKIIRTSSRLLHHFQFLQYCGTNIERFLPTPIEFQQTAVKIKKKSHPKHLFLIEQTGKKEKNLKI